MQKEHWTDYLKQNYLSGQAFALVDHEKNYNIIWTRLHESYGNSRLHLRNKLSAIDKIDGLWEVKEDQKIGNTIAILINVMKDLSNLASKHGILGQLYEWGGLEKIIILICDSRHRKVRGHNLDSSAIRKEEWVNLLKSPARELQLRERLTLDHKTTEMMGLFLNSAAEIFSELNYKNLWAGCLYPGALKRA